MLEALVKCGTGEIVLVRESGHPWGRKEGREPDSDYYVIRLDDPEVESRYKPGSTLAWPYAEWEPVEVEDEDGRKRIEYKMVNRSARILPNDYKSDMTFDDKRRLVQTQVKRVDELIEKIVPLGNVIGVRPKPKPVEVRV